MQAIDSKHLTTRFTICLLPDPSPMTKPSRCASKGRDDFSGVSLYFVDNALRREKPAILKGEMQDSVPPQTMAVAAP